MATEHGSHADVADAGLVRTDRAVGILEKDSEHLSNCDQATHEGTVSFGIDAHIEAVTGREGGL